MTVLPQPKAPGTAHVPPSTEGKMESMTRRPVVRAALPGSFSAAGRGRRTGQKCDSASSCVRPWASFSTTRTVSFTAKDVCPSCPAGTTVLTRPNTLGGHMILWSRIRSFSYTVPKMSPPVMRSPSRTHGVNSQRLSRLREGTSMPRGTNMSPVERKMSSSGRWMPSKMVSMMPGPSSTERGAFLRTTGSPTVRPDVSSYT
mmetsp:Transcript_2048/g.7143  ORF Transcript_2048/g.7143 Transcript_2048/m.7143 type:complete len:201 (+) Transcript_2048:934-1536(+)